MYSVPGLTSRKVQKFLNSICSQANTYLEVGSYLGATAVAALDGNKLDAYFVDKWEEQIQAFRDDIDLPPNDKQVFIENVKKYKGSNNIRLFQCDMFDVDLSEIKPIDVFFYDGPHGFWETSEAIQYYSKVFNDQCIVIVDDANFDGVVGGAEHGISKLKCDILYKKIILNDIESEDEWWNGLFIAVLSNINNK